MLAKQGRQYTQPYIVQPCTRIYTELLNIMQGRKYLIETGSRINTRNDLRVIYDIVFTRRSFTKIQKREKSRRPKTVLF